MSVWFGVCDDGVRGAIQAGYDAAVSDALGNVERRCGHARRGHDGLGLIAGDGLVAAEFHGRWSALDSRALSTHAKTAGYLYEARLRAELTRRLGVD